jgi:hypothetical protein
MAHVDSVTTGSSVFLAVRRVAQGLANISTLAGVESKMALNGNVQLKGVSTFPEFGEPANIVQVPSYGSHTSTQIAGQSDRPTLEFELAYNAEDFDTTWGAMLGDGLAYAMQISIVDRAPPNIRTINDGGIAGTLAAPVKNTTFLFAGTLSSLTIVPSLTDAVKAKLVITMMSDMFGPVTYTATV